MVVSLMLSMAVPGRPPKVTDVVPVRLAPVMVTVVPPVVGPKSGLRPLAPTTGAAR